MTQKNDESKNGPEVYNEKHADGARKKKRKKKK